MSRFLPFAFHSLLFASRESRGTGRKREKTSRERSSTGQKREGTSWKRERTPRESPFAPHSSGFPSRESRKTPQKTWGTSSEIGGTPPGGPAGRRESHRRTGGAAGLSLAAVVELLRLRRTRAVRVLAGALERQRPSGGLPQIALREDGHRLPMQRQLPGTVLLHLFTSWNGERSAALLWRIVPSKAPVCCGALPWARLDRRLGILTPRQAGIMMLA